MEKITNQHGDVLFVSIEEIPKQAKKIIINDGFVIEHGEGVHTHVFPEIENIEVFEVDGKTYVKVKKDSIVDHEEHGKQIIKKGNYLKRIERVWDYESEEARKVID